MQHETAGNPCPSARVPANGPPLCSAGLSTAQPTGDSSTASCASNAIRSVPNQRPVRGHRMVSARAVAAGPARANTASSAARRCRTGFFEMNATSRAILSEPQRRSGAPPLVDALPQSLHYPTDPFVDRQPRLPDFGRYLIP